MHISLLLLITGVVYGGLRKTARHILFKPQPTCWPVPFTCKKVRYRQITALYLPARAGYPTILFFHGRGGNVSHFASFAQTYAPLGYGVFLCDYRGFGLSKGTPSQHHMQQDALNALDYLLRIKKIPPQQVVIYGHSLGCAAALFVAGQRTHLPLKALILQSPFLNTPHVAATWALQAYRPQSLLYHLVRWAVTPFLWGNLFNNAPLAAKSSLPALVCCSRLDRTLPWQQSFRLARLLPRATTFLSATGGHDEFAWTVNAVTRFLA